ncbi:hypothetical protein ITP53_29000 [Nonomuraea sp. K274]|uniref:Uncharacterized protein n=1 Tax=Nonomuraea cypriaca TaxID=1187855 RepID=A0A931AEN7_9ACTN|nr:hypothetical protein [Nonomuraea cypriaca]MBF8189699.1 hypothetical protein [Nonomuraea cypriaca]
MELSDLPPRRGVEVVADVFPAEVRGLTVRVPPTGLPGRWRALLRERFHRREPEAKGCRPPARYHDDDQDDPGECRP